MVGKIGEGYPPFFILAVGMAFVDKLIDSVTLADVALIILAVMFVDDFFLSCRNSGRRGWLSVAGNKSVGGLGMYLDMSPIGTEILVKSSNSMRYACCLAGWVGSRGMSTTVPERMVWVDGSSCLATERHL